MAVNMKDVFNDANIINLAILLQMQSRRNEALGHGAFDFPEFGPPFFTVTMGIEEAFRFGSISKAWMASPVFENHRRGNWLIDFFFNRLSQTPVLAAEKDKLANWIVSRIFHIT